MQRSPSPAEVSEALERALARPELASGGDPLSRLVEDLVEWLAEILEWGLPPGAPQVAAQVALWVVLGLLAALLVVLLLRLGRDALPELRRQGGAVSAVHVQRRVAELRARARAAEAKGEWVEALRLDFFALVVGLGQRGDLEYRDAWTNRELLARGEPSPALAQVLAPLVHELDARSFGGLGADRADVRRFASVCERLLGEEP